MANSLFGMMNSSSTGLMVSQAAINITGNNITNMHTVGYTRQRVIVGNNSPIYYRGTGYIGTGVNIKDVQRIRDSYLTEKIQTEVSTLTEYQAKESVLAELETIFKEPSDTGLNQKMTEMWNSWEELSKNADNSTMETLLKENSAAVADQLNEFTTQLNKVLEDINEQQAGQTDIAADLIDQINELNTLLDKAYRNDPTTTPNELLDKRDVLTKQLAEFMPIEVEYGENHTVTISTPVNGTDVDVLALDKEAIKDMTPDFKTGSLKGFEDAKKDVAQYQGQLNEYTKALATAINDVHVSHGGEPIFTFDENNAAGTVEINPNLKDIVAGTTGNGDGSVALEILELRNKPVEIDGKETKFDQFYKDMIGDLGVKSKHAQSMVEGQETVLNYLLIQEESVSGVSIDEEVVNLVQYQKAYDANAKVISTITEMLDTIINGLGA